MSDFPHNGDLAEYRGRVKRWRGKPCVVIDNVRASGLVQVAFDVSITVYALRHVKAAHLKRLGGGC